MGYKKSGLTATRHIEIGQRLNEMRNEIMYLFIEFAQAYPMTGERGRVYRDLKKAYDALNDAKNRGDSLSCDEHPEVWCMHWYYPANWEDHGEMPHLCSCMRTSPEKRKDAVEAHNKKHGTRPSMKTE